MADDSVQVKFGADIGDLRARLELARAEFAKFSAEARNLATQMVAAGAATDRSLRSALTSASADAAKAKADIAALTSEVESGSAGFSKFGAEARHVVAIFDEFSRGARGQMIGSIIALTRDSGLLEKALSALKGPMGIVIGLAATLAGGFYLLAQRAAEAARQIREVSAAAAMQGRDVEAAVASVQRWTETMAQSGMLSHSGAQTVADAIAKIPNIADATREKIAGIGEALTVEMGGDAKKAAAEIDRAFGSISGLAHFADQNNMMTASAVEAMAKEKGAVAAYDAVINAAQGRLSGYAAAAKKAQEDAATLGTGMAMAGGAAIPITPKMMFPLQFPQGTMGPTPEQRQLLSDIHSGSREYEEMNGLVRQQQEILGSIRSGEAERLGQLDRAKAALMEIEERMDALRKKGEARPNERDDESKAYDFDRHVHIPKPPSTAGADRAAREDYQAFVVEERDKLAAARGNADAQNVILDQWRAKAAATFQAGSAAYRSAMAEIGRAAQQVRTRTVAEMEQAAQATQRAGELIIRGIEAQNLARTKMTGSQRLTPEQAYTSDAKTVMDQFAATKAAYDDIINSPSATADQVTKARESELEAALQAKTQIDQLNENIVESAQKTAQAWAAPFKTAIDQLGSTFESALKGLVTGKRVNVLQQLASSGIDLAGSLASKGTAALLGASGGQGLGEFLGNKALGLLGLGGNQGGQAALVASETALNTTIATLTTAVAANTAALTTAAGAATTSAGASLTGGGISAGGAAAGAAAGGGGLFSWLGGLFAFSRGGIVPAAAGGWALPSSFGTDRVMAALTPGETVLPVGERPSQIMQGIRGMLGSLTGDTHLHIHGNIIDAPAVARFFRDNRSHIAAVVSGSLRSGAINPLAGR